MEDNCHVEPIQKTISAEESRNVEMALLTVSGMGCPNCASRVRNGLLSLRGVVNAYADHTAGIAGVAFNHEIVNIEMLINTVARAGNDGRYIYDARLFSWEKQDGQK